MDESWEDCSYTIGDREIVVTSADGTRKLIFPFYWRGHHRAFTYASVDAPEPQIETWNGQGWTTTRMNLTTFSAWMPALARLPHRTD